MTVPSTVSVGFPWAVCTQSGNQAAHAVGFGGKIPRFSHRRWHTARRQRFVVMPETVRSISWTALHARAALPTARRKVLCTGQVQPQSQRRYSDRSIAPWLELESTIVLRAFFQANFDSRCVGFDQGPTPERTWCFSQQVHLAGLPCDLYRALAIELFSVVNNICVSSFLGTSRTRSKLCMIAVSVYGSSPSSRSDSTRAGCMKYYRSGAYHSNEFH